MATSRVTVRFPCPVEQVWQTVTDLTHTAWRSDLNRVEVLDSTHFVEHTKSGYAANFTVTACEPPHFWAADLHRGGQCKTLVDAPLCPRLSEAAAEVVSGRSAEGINQAGGLIRES